MENNIWWYQGSPITEDKIPSWSVGFIYRIMKKIIVYDHSIAGDIVNRMVYIGKKSLTSTRKKKIGVRAQAKQKAETGDGRVKKVERITKSSGWENYWSSCKELQEEVKAHPELYEKHIIEFCYSKKNMTYLELKYQFLYNVLEHDTFNANINGSLYKHDTDRQLYEEYKQKRAAAPKKPRVKKQIKY